MPTIALSKSALAVLRFRAKNWPTKARENNRDAYRELVDAGIMAPDGDDFRFTEDGWAHRDEIIARAEAYHRSQEPRLPERIVLSNGARDVLRRYLAGDDEVGDATRPAFRELVAAGVMMSVGTFTKGDDCVFQLTPQGWERRFELLSCAKESA